MFPLALLPNCEGLHLQQIVINSAGVVLFLQSTSRTAACPCCGSHSHRVHSHYPRQLADLPCRGRTARLQVRVRRFFCTEPTCHRRIFAERFSALATPYARTTLVLKESHRAIGLALGGEAIARLVRLEALARFEQIEAISRPWLKSEAVRGEIHYALSITLGEQSDLLSQLGKYELAVAKQEEKLQYDTADHRGANYLSLAKKRLDAGDRKGAREAAIEAGKDPKLEGEAKEWIKNFLTNEKH